MHAKKGGTMMQLVPWRRRRTGDLRPFREDWDDLWDRFFGDFPLLRRGQTEWMPDIDVSETDGQIQVKAELPGMEAKDIDVNVTGDLLMIRGHKKQEEEKEGEHYYCRERYSGEFQRSLRLPSPVKADHVDASFKNGVLNVTLAKTEESKPKKIEIKTE
jgi:HSP20 family protein